ncbi:MAG: alginate export family protein [Planctomycetota bacterium]
MREHSARAGRSVGTLFVCTLTALGSASAQETPAAPPEAPPNLSREEVARQAADIQVTPAADAADEKRPWRLQRALDLPEWLIVGGTIRGRFEHTDERFRRDQNGHNQAFVMRSLLAITIQDEILSVTGELQDSRVYLSPDDALLNTTIVNTFELLQGYVAARFVDAFTPNDRLRLQLGRHTMDIGSRRLTARNRYRNTINTFLGLNAQWASEEGSAVRAFYTHPTNRLPGNGEQQRLRDNEVQFDEERSRNQFYGVHGSRERLLGDVDAELYYFGRRLGDVRGINVADREIHSVGTRWKRARKRGAYFWEVEGVYQFGDSRNGDSPDADLNHRAWFAHASAGYNFDAAWQPRIEALFDYASGDRDPNDNENNRFSTLFGARRFEFGPTGIFGAFARANLISPGIRFVGRIAPKWELMVTSRQHFLASKRDSWTTTGLRDPDGNSGRFIGNLTEFRTRYNVVEQSLLLEFGAAYLSAGEFIRNTSDGEDSLYTYVQLNFTF